MKNNREPVNGPRAAHNLANPSEALESGPGWIRTNHTQKDDSGRLAPRSDPQGSESTETAGTLSPETVGPPEKAHWHPLGDPLPFDDPPEDAGDSGAAKGSSDGYVNPDTQHGDGPIKAGATVRYESPREPAPQISLEDRLYVALSARGALSMCQVIVLATGAVQPFHVKDEDLVSLVEDWVFGAKGSRDGAPE